MGNKVVHFELMGPDGDAMRDFYGSVFGWGSQAVPGFAGYHMVDAETAGVGGAVGKGTEDMPQYFTMYVEVDDIDVHLETIAAAGGTTVVPRTVIPDMVTFAMFTDPAGNVVGLVEADETS